MTVSGNIGESRAQSLALNDAGTLILSGSDSYSGGTIVNQGTLITTSDVAILDGTSLTVGAGGTFIFDPAATAAPLACSVPAGAVAAVPEPGTLLLLAAGLCGAAVHRRLRRRKVGRGRIRHLKSEV